MKYNYSTKHSKNEIITHLLKIKYESQIIIKNPHLWFIDTFKDFTILIDSVATLGLDT